MEFHGRKQEILSLSEPGDPYFIVLWGRRRIGKTSLALRAFKDPLYFFVGRKTTPLLLEEFTEVVRKEHKFVPTFKDWEEFFTYLFREFDGTIIIDEFQNFNFFDPSVYSTLQKILDGSNSYRLVVVGSYVGMMKRIFMDSKEPLFGRSTGNMRIGPLSFPVICEILEEIGIKDLKEKISIYSVFGGVPYYYVLMERMEIRSLDECLEKLVFSQMAPLRSEVKNVLIEEFGRNYNSHFSILQAIASGKTTVSEISDATSIKVQSLGKYLQELIEVYDVLERVIPFAGGKRGLYRISDPFTRFWFRYVESHLSELESGRNSYSLGRAMDEMSMVSSWEFEIIVRDLLGKEFNRTERWWNREGDEIDVIAINDKDRIVLFGEVKWTNRKVGEKELDLLMKRSGKVGVPKGYEKKYLLVSRSGFRKKYLGDDTILWDLDIIDKRVRRALEKDR